VYFYSYERFSGRTPISSHSASEQERVLSTRKGALRAQLLRFGALGRVYLSGEGVNGQMVIPQEHTEQCSAFLRHYYPSAEFYVQRSERFTDSWLPFDSLRVNARPALVADDLAAEVASRLDTTPSLCGVQLSPAEWHSALSRLEHTAESSCTPPASGASLIDVRNWWEHEVGRFEGAERFEIDCFRELFPELEQLVRRRTSTDPQHSFYIYCTGGIRCVKVAGWMQQKLGVDRVYRLRGGITAYEDHMSEQRDRVRSRWRGRNVHFDRRMVARREGEREGERQSKLLPADDTVIAKCTQCGAPADTHTNCANLVCGVLFVQCDACYARFSGACSEECARLARERDQHNRTRPPSRSTGTARLRPPLSRRFTSSVAAASSLDNKQQIAHVHVSANEVHSETTHPLRNTMTTPASKKSPPSTNTATTNPTNTPIADPIARPDSLVSADIHAFCNRFSSPPGSHLPEPATKDVGPYQGQFLASLVAALQPDAVLELGTHRGYSALCMLAALSSPSATITSVDNLESCVLEAAHNVRTHPRGSRVSCVHSDALSYLQRMAEEGRRFDFVFVDAGKRNYGEMLDLLLGDDPTERPGVLSERGLILFDNVWLSGRTARSENVDTATLRSARERRIDKLARNMHSFLCALEKDSRCHTAVLPIRDGVALVRRRT